MATKKGLAGKSHDELIGLAAKGESVDLEGMMDTLGLEDEDSGDIVDEGDLPEGEKEELPPARTELPATRTPEPREAEAADTADSADSADDDDEPSWISDLPESAQKEARRLHRANVGQRHSIARERERREEAERDRSQATAIAMGLRRQMVDDGRGDPGADPASSAPRKPARPTHIDTEVDDDGNIRIPIEKLRSVIDERAQEIAQQHSQVTAQTGAAGAYANQLLSEAGVSEASSQRWLQAIQWSAQQLAEVVRRTGRMPRTPGEERTILEEAGVGKELSKRFGGIRLHDVYDVYEAARDPYNYGHRLVDITSRYEREWGGDGGAASSAAKRQPARIPEHPAPMSRKGSSAQSNAAVKTVDRVGKMSLDQMVEFSKDKKAVRDFFTKWDPEIREEEGS
jgi:hypothetical protein